MAKAYKCDNCGKLVDDTGKIYIIKNSESADHRAKTRLT